MTMTQTDSRAADRPGPLGQAAPRWRRIVGWVYRRIRGLLALSMLILIVLVFTPLTGWLQDLLDVTQPPQVADYIVCLGGEDERLIWTAELFKQGYAPKVIVSNIGEPALVMKSRMENMGVPPDRLMVDEKSRTTADHPGCIAALEGIDPTAHRFLIVTNLEHSRRAAACFRKGGYGRFSIFVGRPSTKQEGPLTARNWRARAMIVPTLAYEYTALVKYWLQNKI